MLLSPRATSRLPFSSSSHPGCPSLSDWHLLIPGNAGGKDEAVRKRGKKMEDRRAGRRREEGKRRKVGGKKIGAGGRRGGGRRRRRWQEVCLEAKKMKRAARING